jgi:hypothetical protein
MQQHGFDAKTLIMVIACRLRFAFGDRSIGRYDMSCTVCGRSIGHCGVIRLSVASL